MNNLYQQLNQQPMMQQQNNSQKSFTPSNQRANIQNMIQDMLATDPRNQNLVQAMKVSGMTPKQFFLQYANKQGVNTVQFLDSLNNMIKGQ